MSRRWGRTQWVPQADSAHRKSYLQGRRVSHAQVVVPKEQLTRLVVEVLRIAYLYRAVGTMDRRIVVDLVLASYVL